MKVNNCLRYYVYLTRETYGLPDAIATSYGWSMVVDSENAVEAPTGATEGKELDYSEGSEGSKDSDKSG